jgi:Ca2+-binding EF-hand superfamily protein
MASGQVMIKSILIFFVLAFTLAEAEVKASGLKVEYINVPETCHKKAVQGQWLTLDYAGTLEDGTIFDTSLDKKEPAFIQIGVGQAIEGWEEGVVGMCVGEKRRLIIPPELGYGDQGLDGKIPGQATLIFDIVLLDTEEEDLDPVNVFKQIDQDADSKISKEELRTFLKPDLNIEAMQATGGDQTKQDQEMLKDIVNADVEEIFSLGDKDQDGYVSLEEFADLDAFARHERMFKQIDQDADSKISKEELRTFFKQDLNNYINDIQATEQAQKRLIVDADVEKIFNLFEDKDMDGYMSLEEFVGPKNYE